MQSLGSKRSTRSWSRTQRHLHVAEVVSILGATNLSILCTRVDRSWSMGCLYMDGTPTPLAGSNAPRIGLVLGQNAPQS